VVTSRELACGESASLGCVPPFRTATAQFPAAPEWALRNVVTPLIKSRGQTEDTEAATIRCRAIGAAMASAAIVVENVTSRVT